MFDEAQLQALARWVSTSVARSGSSDTTNFSTLASSGAGHAHGFVVNLVGPYLRTVAPAERPLHVQAAVSSSKVLAKVTTNLTLLLVSDIRTWVIQVRDGVMAQPRTYELGQLRVTTKRVLHGRMKEVGGFLEVLSSPRDAAELTHLIATHGASGPTSTMLAALGGPSNPTQHQGTWHPDPTGRHQLRWWDGQRWTEAVSDDAVTSYDPL